MRKSEIVGHPAQRAGMRMTRALSASRAIWQWRRAWLISALMLSGAGWTAPAVAGPDGPAFVVRRGDYTCELPGTALTAAGLHQPQEDFGILQGSLYTSPAGRGTYLATGDEIRMTTGPKTGERYRRVSDNYLRKLTADGKESNIRCIRRVLNNQ